MDEGLLSLFSAGSGQLVKMRITLEPHDIFRSNFAYLFIYYISVTGMHNEMRLSLVSFLPVNVS